MDYRKLSQDKRDKLLKEELSEEKVKLLEKFGLESKPDLTWVSNKENSHEQLVFKHNYLKKNDIIHILFRVNKLCFAKVNYFSRNSEKFEPQIYDYKEGFKTTEWWNADFILHTDSGYRFDLRFFQTITEIEEFHKLCASLEEKEKRS